jgi:hypothetical protein
MSANVSAIYLPFNNKKNTQVSLHRVPNIKLILFFLRQLHHFHGHLLKLLLDLELQESPESNGTQNDVFVKFDVLLLWRLS